MDDDFQLLEAELKRLRPLAPSAELNGGLDTALSPRKNKFPPARTWLALPAAAAIAVLFALNSRRTPVALEKPVPPSSLVAAAVVAFKPVHAENVLLNSRDEGYVTLADGTPARRVRESYVDMITWKNPRTNASLVWSVPREEIRVMPVNFQ